MLANLSTLHQQNHTLLNLGSTPLTFALPLLMPDHALPKLGHASLRLRSGLIKFARVLDRDGDSGAADGSELLD
jgi:hypothetical protein